MSENARAEMSYDDIAQMVGRAIAARWAAEGLHSDSDAEVDAYVALDALTKPRIEKCPAPGCVNGYRTPKLGIKDSWDGDCPVCSGSGSVTRGPIAVLVPPDTVEIMATAERESYDAENDVVPSQRQCEETARVMLDALTSDCLASPEKEPTDD